ncbi:hypothetical protein [Sphingosinicella humi]|uniref:Uncharacterized protein n=1 Tax=Allosphingosinicella humi TaxID=2068657 RepID=A0A2U2J2V9_9SPHN|nr:hypothetical protein [Sphingosinicella humi]PWG02611.1 hypothetical protein DF286_06825 [Sphingosinicella humi]
MVDEENDVALSARARAGSLLNKLERIYLGVIRAIALVAATLLVVYAAWLAISGVYKASLDVETVKEVPASVSPEEVTKIDTTRPANSDAAENSDPFADEKRYYADFTKRYLALFSSKFEAFKRPEDKRLDAEAFDARYVNSSERLESIRDGSLDYAVDKADLESWLDTLTTVASSKSTVDRLKAYQSAKMTKVSRTIKGTREQRYCSYYAYYFDECLTYDTRTVPFTRTVDETKLPDGVMSHTDLLGAYQDRYFDLLLERRRANAGSANMQRAEIAADNQDGSTRLWMAVRVVGVFVVLMFLFLLIALERHQRRISASLRADSAETAA